MTWTAEKGNWTGCVRVEILKQSWRGIENFSAYQLKNCSLQRTETFARLREGQHPHQDLVLRYHEVVLTSIPDLAPHGSKEELRFASGDMAIGNLDGRLQLTKPAATQNEVQRATLGTAGRDSITIARVWIIVKRTAAWGGSGKRMEAGGVDLGKP